MVPLATRHPKRVSAGHAASGVPGGREMAACPGRAPLSTMKRVGRIASVECLDGIPCDPCVAACPSGAILKSRITDLPVLNPEECTGCALCIPACPGQAIFVVDMLAGEVTLPYEFLPVPTEGELVDCLDRTGRSLQDGRVTRVFRVKGHDDVSVVTVRVDPALSDQVRAIRAGDPSR